MSVGITNVDVYSGRIKSAPRVGSTNREQKSLLLLIVQRLSNRDHALSVLSRDAESVSRISPGYFVVNPGILILVQCKQA